MICKVYTGYHGTSEIGNGLCACMVDNPLSKVWGLSLCTAAQTMLYHSHVAICPLNAKTCNCPLMIVRNTVDSRYLEIEGTLKNSSRYPYFDISDL